MRPALLALASALALALAAPFALGQNDTGNATATTTSADATNATSNETAPTPEAPAGPPPAIEVNLEGRGEGGSFFWTIAGSSSHNPLIQVEPGQKVTFHVTTVSGAAHNIKICANKPADACMNDASVKPSAVIKEGDTIDIEWTAPDAAGTATYICTIHGATMSGRIQVGKAAPTTTTGGGDLTGTMAGETVELGAVYHGDLPDACKTFKIPAVASKSDPAKPYTGGPSVADYAKWCTTGGDVPRPASSADYVIPISFAAIGIGIVGVVWAHRFYKP